MDQKLDRRCPHAGFHTGRARYRRSTTRLHYVVVCDDCDAELRQVSEIEYVPTFAPDGRPPRAGY